MQKLWINADGGRWYSNAIGCDFRQICKIWKTGKIQKYQSKWPEMIQNHQQMSKLPEYLSKLAKSHHKSVFTRVGARERYTFKNFSTFTFQNNTFIPKLPNILKLTVHRQKNKNAIFETGIASKILNCSNAFPRHISRHISRLFMNEHVYLNWASTWFMWFWDSNILVSNISSIGSLIASGSKAGFRHVTSFFHNLSGSKTTQLYCRVTDRFLRF